MKNNRMRIALVLCLCVIAFGAWDKDKPASSTSLRSSNPLILGNQAAVETSFGAYHEFSTGGTNSGENLSIKFNAPITTPTHADNKLWIYGKDSAGSVIEAYILDESGNELQITSGGDLYSSAGLTVTSASTFNGSITLGAGDDLIGSSTSDITINTSMFTVAGATGNTVVAGTLDVSGNIDPTTYETTNGGFLDEDAMGSDSATKVCSQQSIKKYVGDQIDAAVEGAGFVKYSGATVFNDTMTSANTWQDLDLSGTVGSRRALVFLEIGSSGSPNANYMLKPKGWGSATFAFNYGFTAPNIVSITATTQYGYCVCMTDSSGKISHGASSNSTNFVIKIITYII